MSRQMVPAPQMPAGGRAPWDAPKYSFKSYFSYESDTTAALAPAGSSTLTFNIAGDSDFFWTKFQAFALVGSDGTLRNADQLPAVTMLLTNTTTGRSYSNTPNPLPNISGTGSLPFILPQITLWENKSTIQIQLANASDNTTYSAIYLTFSGIKAYLA